MQAALREQYGPPMMLGMEARHAFVQVRKNGCMGLHGGVFATKAVAVQHLTSSPVAQAVGQHFGCATCSNALHPAGWRSDILEMLLTF